MNFGAWVEARMQKGGALKRERVAAIGGWVQTGRLAVVHRPWGECLCMWVGGGPQSEVGEHKRRREGGQKRGGAAGRAEGPV